jgi:hypothetical protein
MAFASPPCAYSTQGEFRIRASKNGLVMRRVSSWPGFAYVSAVDSGLPDARHPMAAGVSALNTHCRFLRHGPRIYVLVALRRVYSGLPTQLSQLRWASSMARKLIYMVR